MLLLGVLGLVRPRAGGLLGLLGLLVPSLLGVALNVLDRRLVLLVPFGRLGLGLAKLALQGDQLGFGLVDVGLDPLDSLVCGGLLLARAGDL